MGGITGKIHLFILTRKLNEPYTPFSLLNYISFFCFKIRILTFWNLYYTSMVNTYKSFLVSLFLLHLLPTKVLATLRDLYLSVDNDSTTHQVFTGLNSWLRPPMVSPSLELKFLTTMQGCSTTLDYLALSNPHLEKQIKQ